MDLKRHFLPLLTKKIGRISKPWHAYKMPNKITSSAHTPYINHLWAKGKETTQSSNHSLKRPSDNNKYGKCHGPSLRYFDGWPGATLLPPPSSILDKLSAHRNSTHEINWDVLVFSCVTPLVRIYAGWIPLPPSFATCMHDVRPTTTQHVYIFSPCIFPGAPRLSLSLSPDASQLAMTNREFSLTP